MTAVRPERQGLIFVRASKARASVGATSPPPRRRRRPGHSLSSGSASSIPAPTRRTPAWALPLAGAEGQRQIRRPDDEARDDRDPHADGGDDGIARGRCCGPDRRQLHRRLPGRGADPDADDIGSVLQSHVRFSQRGLDVHAEHRGRGRHRVCRCEHLPSLVVGACAEASDDLHHSCSTVWWSRHPSSTGGGSARVARRRRKPVLLRYDAPAGVGRALCARVRAAPLRRVVFVGAPRRQPGRPLATADGNWPALSAGEFAAHALRVGGAWAGGPPGRR